MCTDAFMIRLVIHQHVNAENSPEDWIQRKRASERQADVVREDGTCRNVREISRMVWRGPRVLIHGNSLRCRSLCCIAEVEDAEEMDGREDDEGQH